MLNRLLERARVQTLEPVARRVKADRLTYLSAEKLSRLLRSADAALANGAGDVLEFGVALGGSGILLAHRARAAGARFAGFDVFGMIPPPTSDKDDAKSKERYQVIASGQSSGIGGDEYYGYRSDLYGDVCRAFAAYGVPADGASVLLVKGLFEETWPGFENRPVAFAHIDCDWYDPVKYCLEAVTPHLQSGGVIVLDDYNDYGGCRAATDEFLDANAGLVLDNGANAILRRAE
jgi:asparagine synthase (glutamine-hydrolysing)